MTYNANLWHYIGAIYRKRGKIMIISQTEKKALRRVQADNKLTKEQMAIRVGVSAKTLRLILNNDEPQKINNTTYKKIARCIASNY